jgi:hypothetical protein
LFSRRDEVTKNINLNDFELNLIAEWKSLTGTDLHV